MISVFKGFVLPRFYWQSAWSGRRGKYILEPLRRLFKVGPLRLYLTAYYRWSTNPYKYEALKLMREHFELRSENISGAVLNPTVMWSCYSKQDGSYVGTPEDTIRYLHLGIREFYTRNGGKVACIGWDPEKRLWYGWSHRAIYGFGIGHIVQEGSIVRSNGWIEGCPEYEESERIKPQVGYVARTRSDCRYLAERFAEAVG